MSAPKILFGFHAVGVRLKTAPASVIEVYYETSRRDARMRQFLDRVRDANVRLIEADGMRLNKLAGSAGHQGVAARVETLPVAHSRARNPASKVCRWCRPTAVIVESVVRLR